MVKEISSPRFIWGKDLVRDLCIREEDYVQSKRMLYISVLRDAFIKLNLKTEMFTTRVALPVNHDLNYILTPKNYLELSSISAPNHDGKWQPMIISTKVDIDVADLSLAKRCGCSCGCAQSQCTAVRNFETIYGTMAMKMPDNTTQTFTTTYRKIILEDGSFVEETTVPTQTFINNVHTATGLKKQTKLLCNLDLEECGCIKDTVQNRQNIESACTAIDVPTECGCAAQPEGCTVYSRDGLWGHSITADADIMKPRDLQYNIDEEGDRIYLPTNFNHDYVVLRYWANTKTKDIRIPFLAKEAMISGIKVITTTFSKKEKGQAEFWKQEYKSNTDILMENLADIKLESFYESTLGRFDSV